MENNLVQKQNGAVSNGTEKNITDGVLTRVNQLTESRELVLPKNYSPENALKFAYLELKASNLLNTDKDALAAALLNMCVQGLSPQKKQCYFINYGGKVGLMRSYHGDRAVAKLSGLVKEIQAYVIYQGDEVNISYEEETNFLQVEHKTKFENWHNPIVGAYAVAVMPDGSKRYDLMTIERIRKSWNMSSNKSNNKLQSEFETEACQRTVTRHLVKNLFNQSTDESLLINNVIENDEYNENATPTTEETKYDENQVLDAQIEETGSITPKVVEEEKPIQNQKPTKQDVINARLGIEPDKNKVDF